MAFTFGSNSTTSNSSGFGAAPVTNAFNTTASSAPSFGSTPAPSFGAASTSTSGFGATPATSFGTSTNTGFGATGGFGGTPAVSNTTSLFGAAPSTGLSFGGAQKPGLSFGNPSGGQSTFGSQSFGGSFGQKTNEQQKKQKEQQVYQLLCELNKDAEASTLRKGFEAKNVWQALALLKSYYDPKSSHCRFRHYFYNLVSPQEVHLYQMPIDHDPKEWETAQKENPDPTKLVPALAIGFDDIQKRIDQQNKLSEAHQAKLRELQTILNTIKEIHLVKAMTKLNECKQKHMEMTQRLISFMKYDQVLRSKGLSITAQEEAMLARLENVQDQLQRSELFHGKMNQLWAQLQLIKESGRKYGKIDNVDWHAVSDQHMKEITKNLSEQNKGIHHIIQVLNTDEASIENATKGFYRRI
ncbi:nucleoporin complex subunit 54-domain-containing protein [Sporodiniella umbellata]|nr:nucleoporin complex subunit 54-domain-containing protein [Sporodiniella umbellata]